MKLKIVAGVLVFVVVLAAGWLWTPDKNRALLEARYANAPEVSLQAVKGFLRN